MKKLKEVFLRYKKVADIMACFALVFAVAAANSPCFYIYHDIEKPNLKKLRKF